MRGSTEEKALETNTHTHTYKVRFEFLVCLCSLHLATKYIALMLLWIQKWHNDKHIENLHTVHNMKQNRYNNANTIVFVRIVSNHSHFLAPFCKQHLNNSTRVTQRKMVQCKKKFIRYCLLCTFSVAFDLVLVLPLEIRCRIFV